MYLAQNLKALRKAKDLTQEEVAEMLHVSPQSVSKWERGETMPDITLLPTLANLYRVSVDAIIGMDQINSRQTMNAIFTAGHQRVREGNIDGAIEVYSEALKTFPNDEAIMTDLAMSLALADDPGKLEQAALLCESVLAGNSGDKVHHTARAALCFIYLKRGEKDRAVTAAKKLPHLRESRERVLTEFDKIPTLDEINAYIKFIAIGEIEEQDILIIDFGIDMVSVIESQGLLDKIKELRMTQECYRALPQIRIRDNTGLAPNRVRVRSYADYLLDREYTDTAAVTDDIIEALGNIARKKQGE